MIIYTEEKINASNKIIWETLINTNKYHKWNRLIRAVSGELKVGSKIWVFVRLPNGFPLLFKAYVLEMIPEKKLSWTASFLSSYLIKGHHSFEIQQINDTSCLFIQQETFDGSLHPIGNILYNQIKKGFNNMNKDFKNFIEKV